MNLAYKNELLASALEAREREFTEYQVNIDNFKIAIKMINDDPEMQEFKKSLEQLLASSILEQRKSGIMLDVIKLQMGVN